MSAPAVQADVVQRLVGLARRSVEQDPGQPLPHEGEDSIRRLGMDSVKMLSFLVAVEDEFGIEWSDDIPSAVLASFEHMAAHIVRELGHAG